MSAKGDGNLGVDGTLGVEWGVNHTDSLCLSFRALGLSYC
ncbi:hypothetical protein Lepto7375DRAFT_6116 [Leptolyngbya sp. PCC 7375]|nr:hypothetical protein Lepto7375DRAFT_6116 [Leptolyngbya sp. PCC 7375]